MDLSSAIGQYLQDRKAKRFAAGTIRQDKQILTGLLTDIGNIQVRNIRIDHIDTFWRVRANWADGSLVKAKSILSSFFKWCRVRGYMPRDLDPLEGVRVQPSAPRQRVYIPQEEFSTFLDGIKNPRHRAVAAIGLYLFARKSEIRLLRWQDYQGGGMQVQRPKVRRSDTLPVCEELSDELARWRFAYGREMGETPKPGWFIIPGSTTPTIQGKDRDGKLVLRESSLVPTRSPDLGNMITAILKGAGYYRPFEGGHTLRRSGGVALYNQLTSVGHDRAIRIVQAMYGHSSVAMTEKYLDLSLDRKVRDDILAGQRMFPAAQEATVITLGGGNGHTTGRAGGV